MQVTFVQYVPAHLKIGVPHPDPVVENASLSAVRPPAITYELRLARKVIEKGYLSDLQLESLVYAAQQHEKFDGEKRKGFFIGDGAGVGKGRQLAGRFDRGGMLLCRSTPVHLRRALPALFILLLRRPQGSSRRMFSTAGASTFGYRFLTISSATRSATSATLTAGRMRGGSK